MTKRTQGKVRHTSVDLPIDLHQRIRKWITEQESSGAVLTFAGMTRALFTLMIEDPMLAVRVMRQAHMDTILATQEKED